MHILLVHQSFTALDEPGGTRHFELASHLIEHGHQVTVIASPISYLTGSKARPSNAQGPETPFPGLTIYRPYTYAAFHRSFIHRLLSFVSFMASSFWTGLQVRQVDIVWGTSPPIFQGVSAWLLARLKGIPFLFEIRDLWPAFAVAVGVLRQPLIIRLSEWLERLLYRQANLVLVNSPGFIQHISSRGAAHIELVPNGADASMFDPQARGEDFRQAHGLSDKFVALYAGAHGLSNDLGIVLEAAKLLQDQPAIRIVLLGDGKDKAALMEQAQAMGLKNVLFLPPVAKNEMPEALAASDACIAILKPVEMYGTVYPNKVFDYMAAGRATVLAIDGVIREVVESAAAGIFVPPGDPQALADTLRRMAAAPDETRQMGLNGRQAIEARFDRPVLAQRLLEILEHKIKR